MCFALCLVCGAFGGYHNLMQEAVPGVIGNQQKCRLEGPEIINNGALERQGSLQIDLWKLICKSASGELSFMLIYVEK